MKIFTRTSFAVAVALAGMSAAAEAAPVRGSFDLSQYRYQIESRSAFSNKRSAAIERLNAQMTQKDSKRFRAQAEDQVKPAYTLGPANITADLDGPNGERWSYVGEYDYEIIPSSGDIQYEDKILREFTFKIYDADMKLVGTIKDKMEYAEDEVRTVLCDLAPVVTRHFFNDDDKYELAVGLGINTTRQQNRYVSVVYQIDGEKEDGYDKPVYSIEQLIADVVEGPAEGGKDTFYMSFADEFYPEEPSDEGTSEGDDGGLGFWDYLCQAHINVDIYGPARGSDGPQKLLNKKIPLLQLPGDQQSTPYIISLERGGDVYFVMSSLEEPFYNRYDDPINDDMSQRDNNNLLVEFYKTDGKGGVALDYTTKIAFKKDEGERVLGSYYSIGNLRYRNDIDFDNFGTPAGRAALYVAKENYLAGSDDDYQRSYYVYDHEGKKIRTLAEDCESTLALSDIPGHEPQCIFITADVYVYYFDFVDLISGKNRFFITSQFEIDPDSDPESLTANFDRVAAGESYMYVNELRMPGVDDKENDIMRFMWLKDDGTFDHIDQVNMGTNVMYAQTYLHSATLDPKAFHSDDNHEYMMLIKRGTEDGGNREELLIGQAITPAQPEGKTLLLCTPDERGVLNGIVPIIDENPEHSFLLVTYLNESTGYYAQDFYPLPLDRKVSGIAPVVTDPTTAITLDGTTVSAQGEISVYSTSGALVARGADTLDLSSLGTGVYIVRAGDNARKLLIK